MASPVRRVSTRIPNRSFALRAVELGRANAFEYARRIRTRPAVLTAEFIARVNVALRHADAAIAATDVVEAESVDEETEDAAGERRGQPGTGENLGKEEKS